MFPTINHINDLLPFIAANPQFRVQEQDNGTTVVCYMLQDEDTFRGEHEDHYKECRGITFDTASGKVVSRTLHKFKNVGEGEDTQPNLIPWDTILRVMDKRDGSMITVVDIDGKLTCKTKKTFTSAEAIAATEFLNADPEKVKWVRNFLEKGYTPTFEWTSPKFPIVLLYEKDELTLLQIRHNVTGDYIINAFLNDFAQDSCPFPVVENLRKNFTNRENKVTYEEFRELQLTEQGVEGWIIQNHAGEMWKIKTKWYCDLHHSVTFTRWRDVARTVLDDKSDDLKAAFAMTGRDIQPIIDVETKVFADIGRMVNEVVEAAMFGMKNELTAKEMAAKYTGHPLMKHIMRSFGGKPTSMLEWMQYYLQRHIDTWSLEVIPTVTQNEDTDELAG